MNKTSTHRTDHRYLISWKDLNVWNENKELNKLLRIKSDEIHKAITNSRWKVPIKITILRLLHYWKKRIKTFRTRNFIDPTAIIHPNAIIWKNVMIWAYTVIDEWATIWDNVIIKNNCYIWKWSRIMTNTYIQPECIIESNVTIWANCKIWTENTDWVDNKLKIVWKWTQIAHSCIIIGNVVIWNNCRIYQNSSIWTMSFPTILEIDSNINVWATVIWMFWKNDKVKDWENFKWVNPINWVNKEELESKWRYVRIN